MDRAVRERLGEGIVDEPVLVDERKADEARARNADLEVVAASRSIDDGDVGRLRERAPEHFLQIGRHGATVAAGRRRVSREQGPCAAGPG